MRSVGEGSGAGGPFGGPSVGGVCNEAAGDQRRNMSVRVCIFCVCVCVSSAPLQAIFCKLLSRESPAIPCSETSTITLIATGLAARVRRWQGRGGRKGWWVGRE